jgi:hypothetical protein
VQFIEKEPRLATFIVLGLLKFWPSTSCQKQLLFLSELEEVLEMTEQLQFQQLIDPVFKRIGMCIASPHFQVAERALFLWNNDVIAAFMSDHRSDILPILYPALHQNSNSHWNATVTQLTQHIMQQFLDMDQALFNSVRDNYKVELAEKKKDREKVWNTLKQNHNVISLKNADNNNNNIISPNDNNNNNIISPNDNNNNVNVNGNDNNDDNNDKNNANNPFNDNVNNNNSINNGLNGNFDPYYNNNNYINNNDSNKTHAVETISG